MLSSAYRYVYARCPEGIAKTARKELGLTQRYVAERLGISPSQISKIENKKAVMSANFWFHFCRLVHLDCDSITYGYCRRWHLVRVRGAIREGDYQLPVSPKLSAALAINERQETRRTARIQKTLFSGFRYSIAEVERVL